MGESVRNESTDYNLQLWALEHDPEEKMLWREAFWKTIILWRNKIIPMFYRPKTIGCDEKDWQAYYLSTNAQMSVIGEHRSKSIINPVLEMNYKGYKIIFRYNFYDYEVAVIGPYDLEFPEKLFLSEKSSFFFQGFPKEYQIEERYETSKNKFMVSISDHYGFFTFMFLLKDQIDKNTYR